MPADQSEVKNHFIAFVVINNQLIEFDGLKQGPNLIKDNCDDVLRGKIFIYISSILTLIFILDFPKELVLKSKEDSFLYIYLQIELTDGEISEMVTLMTLNAL